MFTTEFTPEIAKKFQLSHQKYKDEEVIANI